MYGGVDLGNLTFNKVKVSGSSWHLLDSRKLRNTLIDATPNIKDLDKLIGYDSHPSEAQKSRKSPREVVLLLIFIIFF